MIYLLHQLLEAAATTHPDRSAVLDGDCASTYGEIESRANRMAHLLLRLGVKRGARIGLLLDKSAEAIAAIYGVLKAGAAYVPLDPSAPPYRLAHVLGDCGATVLITNKPSNAWRHLTASGSTIEFVVTVGGDAQSDDPSDGPQVCAVEGVRDLPETPPVTSTIDRDLAYVLYTSGSTGHPKGVMHSHASGLAFVRWAVQEFRVRGDDRVASHAPFHFDLSIFDIFAAAAGRATVVLIPSVASMFPTEITRLVERHVITVWYSVPSILNLLVTTGGLRLGQWASVRLVLFAGEVFPVRHLHRLMTLVPHATFYNLYGPTETNVCTYMRIPFLPHADNEPIGIGSAITNVEVVSLTDAGELAPPGQKSELCVRGQTVMLGYWGDPQKTASVMIPHPSSPGVQDCLYRTGDLVVRQPDGGYRLVGRRDHQVKSRGYRIELGDIEAALHAHPKVLEAVMVAVPNELVSNRIVGYAVAPDAREDELAQFLAQRIPAYMVPARILLRTSLHKTSTGKVDRAALAHEACHGSESDDD